MIKLAATVLNSLNESIFKSGREFSPYDALFAEYFVPSWAMTEHVDISAWFPVSSKTISVLSKVLDELTAQDRSIVEYAFGLKDGKYHSYQDIADTLYVSVPRVIICINGTLKRLYEKEQDKVYATITKKARKEIEKGYVLQRTFSFLPSA